MVKHMCFGCWDEGSGRPSASSGLLNCTILLYTSIIVLIVTFVTF